MTPGSPGSHLALASVDLELVVSVLEGSLASGFTRAVGLEAPGLEGGAAGFAESQGLARVGQLITNAENPTLDPISKARHRVAPNEGSAGVGLKERRGSSGEVVQSSGELSFGKVIGVKLPEAL